MMNITFHRDYQISELELFLPNLSTATLSYMGLMRPEMACSPKWPDPENFNQQ